MLFKCSHMTGPAEVDPPLIPRCYVPSKERDSAGRHVAVLARLQDYWKLRKI